MIYYDILQYILYNTLQYISYNIYIYIYIKLDLNTLAKYVYCVLSSSHKT